MAKRFASLLLVLAMLSCLLSGCSDATREYSCKELTMDIPLTAIDKSDGEESEGYTFVLSNSKIAILGLRETFEELGTDESFTLDDYADALITGNELDTHAISRSNGQYKYFRYSASTDDGSTFRYLAAVYQAEEAFWMVQITASLTDYEEETFLGYLDSVKFD